MTRLSSAVRVALLEAKEEPSVWDDVERAVLGPEDEPSFSREVVRTVQRGVKSAPSTLKGWINNAPQVAAFILSPAGLRDALLRGTIDAFMGAPANAPSPTDPVFTRSAWILTQMHTILQGAGTALDAADVVDSILYFAEAAAEDDDRKKEALLNNGAISLVASIPAFGATLAAGRVMKGAAVTNAQMSQLLDVLEVPEAAALMGRQGVEQAQAAVRSVQDMPAVRQVADPRHRELAELIVDNAKRDAMHKLHAHVDAHRRFAQGDHSALNDMLPNIRGERDLGIARDATMHAKTGDYRVPRTPDPSPESARTAAQSERQFAASGGTAEHMRESRPAIEALSRWGVGTTGVRYTTSHGADATILVGRDGKRHAFYVSSGTGSGTPPGSWVPYRGQSIRFAGTELEWHVVKYAQDSKVPSPRAGADREVYDAANHPDVRDALKRAAQAPGFDDAYVHLPETRFGDLPYNIQRIGKENEYLHKQGVDIGGGDITDGRNYLLPWPSSSPVPAELRGKVITPADIMKGISWSELDALGATRTGTFEQWFLSGSSSELLKPVSDARVLNGFKIEQSTGPMSVVTPVRSYFREGKSRGAWRHAGDPPLPGGIKRGPKRRRPPADPTYGSEPDLLDKAGVIVEPDVRRKIASYYDDMLLREVIKRILSRK